MIVSVDCYYNIPGDADGYVFRSVFLLYLDVCNVVDCYVYRTANTLVHNNYNDVSEIHKLCNYFVVSLHLLLPYLELS